MAALSFDHIREQPSSEEGSGSPAQNNNASNALSFDHIQAETDTDRNHRLAREYISAHPEQQNNLLVDRALHGLTLGLGDEAASFVRSGAATLAGRSKPNEFWSRYDKEKAMMEERYKLAQEKTGLTGDIVDGVGALVPSTAAMKGVSLGAKVIKNAAPRIAAYLSPAAQNVAAGALTGGVEAYGDGENIGTGAALGAGGGLLGSMAGNAVGSVASRIGSRAPEIPTTSDLFSKGDALYKQFGASEGLVTRSGIEDLSGRVDSFLSRPDIAHDATLMPRVEAVRRAIGKYTEPTADLAAEELKNNSINRSLATLGRFSSSPPQLQTALTPEAIQHIRQLALMAQESSRPTEQRAGKLLKGEIDDWISNLSGDKIAGSVDVDAFNQANKVWASAKKAERLDDFMTEARNASSVAGATSEAKLRQVAKKLLNKPRGLSADESALAQRIVDGTPVQNAARFVGDKFNAHSIPSLARHFALHSLTGTTGGVVTGLAAELLGYGSKRATRNSLDTLSRLVRSGGNMSSLQPTVSPLAQRITQATPSVGGILGSAIGSSLLGEDQ